MKKYLIAIILIVTSLISCNEQEYLDFPQQGVLPVEDTYASANDAEVISFITAVYYKIHGNLTDYYGWSGNTTTSHLGLRDVLEGMAGEQGFEWTYLYNADATSYLQMWSYYYSTIYWCNMIIENIPENQVASQAVKDQVIAEARSIRAIMMMQLVQLWGNPPLADHIMTGTEVNTPAEESWAFIEKELMEAAEALPSKGSPDGQSAIGGRLTKEAAYAYLGKAYLWQEKYSEAAATLYNKVISTDLYGLIDDFTELNRYTSDFSKEYLWEFDIANVSGLEISQAGSMGITFNWVVELNTPDDYYPSSGWGYLAYPTRSFGEFFEAHDILNNGVRSNRYRGTMVTYEEMLDETIFSYSSGDKGMKTGTFIGHNQGYFAIKLIPKLENIMKGSDSWTTHYRHNNPCYMRYAEVLLNYAEAVAMGGTSGVLSGRDALNLVRQRAGVPDAPALEMDNEAYGVKAERRAELFFEGHRFIDLVRWGDAAEELASIGKYIYNFWGYKNGYNDVIQSKNQYLIDSTLTTGQGFAPSKNELLPIPTVDITNSGGALIQNPNW